MNSIDILSQRYALEQLNPYELMQDIDAITAPFRSRMLSILACSNPVLTSEKTDDGFKLTFGYDADTNAMIAQLEALLQAAINSYMRQRGIAEICKTSS